MFEEEGGRTDPHSQQRSGRPGMALGAGARQRTEGAPALPSLQVRGFRLFQARRMKAERRWKCAVEVCVSHSHIHPIQPPLAAFPDPLPRAAFVQDTREADSQAPSPALEEFKVRGVEMQTRRDPTSELW